MFSEVTMNFSCNCVKVYEKPNFYRQLKSTKHQLKTGTKTKRKKSENSKTQAKNSRMRT